MQVKKIIHKYKMVCMYSFCFWFSLRLGSLMIGVFCLIESSIYLGLFAYAYIHPDLVKDTISSWIQKYDMTFSKSFFSTLKDHTQSYFMIFMILTSFYIVSCLLLIYASYWCRAGLAWAWAVLELCRLLALALGGYTALALLKQNSTDVGLLIGAAVAAVFLILALFYIWICVISFIQIVTELERAATYPAEHLPVRNAILRRDSEDEALGPFYQRTSYATIPIDGVQWDGQYIQENRRNLRNFGFRDKARTVIDRY